MATTARNSIYLALEDVVRYWFEKPNDYQKWFGGGIQQDELITAHYKKLLDTMTASMESGAIMKRNLSATEQLGLIILFDQFSRHIYRGTAKAFSSDPFSLQLCKQLLIEDKVREYPIEQRIFALMPLQHSESVADKAALIAYVNDRLLDCNLEEHEVLEKIAEHCVGHRAVLQKFGRYPKRNAALGRVSTAAELKHIRQSTTPY